MESGAFKLEVERIASEDMKRESIKRQKERGSTLIWKFEAHEKG